MVNPSLSNSFQCFWKIYSKGFLYNYEFNDPPGLFHSEEWRILERNKDFMIGEKGPN